MRWTVSQARFACILSDTMQKTGRVGKSGGPLVLRRLFSGGARHETLPAQPSKLSCAARFVAAATTVTAAVAINHCFFAAGMPYFARASAIGVAVRVLLSVRAISAFSSVPQMAAAAAASGRTVVVTGADGGIGSSFCRHYANNGDRVFACR